MSEVDPRKQLIALLPDLRGFARFLSRNSSEADDLVHDAIVRALAGLSQFQAGSNLRAWTFTILRNTFHEQARRRRVEARATEQRFAAEEGHSPAQDAQMDMADLQRQLFTLSPLLREALVLVGAQGMSYDEAAVVCGCPAGTVKARVSRARRQLAGLVGGPNGELPALEAQVLVVQATDTPVINVSISASGAQTGDATAGDTLTTKRCKSENSRSGDRIDATRRSRRSLIV